MIAILWKYRVKPEHAEEFERVYGADGDWARLFARQEGWPTGHLSAKTS